MATKNNPGAFDCHENAHPDEPLFTLLGRDVVAGMAVRFWAEQRVKNGLNDPNDPQITDALQCAAGMDDWARSLGKGAQVTEAAHIAYQVPHDR